MWGWPGRGYRTQVGYDGTPIIKSFVWAPPATGFTGTGDPVTTPATLGKDSVLTWMTARRLDPGTATSFKLLAVLIPSKATQIRIRLKMRSAVAGADGTKTVITRWASAALAAWGGLIPLTTKTVGVSVAWLNHDSGWVNLATLGVTAGELADILVERRDTDTLAQITNCAGVIIEIR